MRADAVQHKDRSVQPIGALADIAVRRRLGIDWSTIGFWKIDCYNCMTSGIDAVQSASATLCRHRPAGHLFLTRTGQDAFRSMRSWESDRPRAFYVAPDSQGHMDLRASGVSLTHVSHYGRRKLGRIQSSVVDIPLGWQRSVKMRLMHFWPHSAVSLSRAAH